MIPIPYDVNASSYALHLVVISKEDALSSFLSDDKCICVVVFFPNMSSYLLPGYVDSYIIHWKEKEWVYPELITRLSNYPAIKEILQEIAKWH